jgi:hypothetical protein
MLIPQRVRYLYLGGTSEYPHVAVNIPPYLRFT